MHNKDKPNKLNGLNRKKLTFSAINFQFIANKWYPNRPYIFNLENMVICTQ